MGALALRSVYKRVCAVRTIANVRHIVQCWLEAYRTSYAAMLEERRGRDLEEADAKAAAHAAQPDDLIDFAHLKHRRGVAQVLCLPVCCFAMRAP